MTGCRRASISSSRAATRACLRVDAGRSRRRRRGRSRRRGSSVETSRGDRLGTWLFCGDESRRRRGVGRGYSVETSRGDAAAGTAPRRRGVAGEPRRRRSGARRISRSGAAARATSRRISRAAAPPSDLPLFHSRYLRAQTTRVVVHAFVHSVEWACSPNCSRGPRLASAEYPPRGRGVAATRCAIYVKTTTPARRRRKRRFASLRFRRGGGAISAACR